MTEVEVQQRAKRYLDCLVQGINPLDGTVIPEGDTVRQVRIARCLQYVSRTTAKYSVSRKSVPNACRFR